jgi:tRNA splicing endonuclease
MDVLLARLAAAAFPLGPPVAVSVTTGPSGPVPLVWSAADCVRLRGEGGIAISPLGMCPLKVSTNAKAAAVPAALSDEELFLASHLGWLDCTDAASGAAVDPHRLLAGNEERAAAGGGDRRQRLLLKRAAFVDLWTRGYRMTAGLKFGVDYLAYRSDPSTCHAAFMVRVLPDGQDITPLDLVARARVATTTLKTAVLAYVDLAVTGAAAGQQHAQPPATPALASDPVRYEAFKRMGPGQAVFTAASAMALPLPLPRPAASEEGAGADAAAGAGAGGSDADAVLAAAADAAAADGGDDDGGAPAEDDAPAAKRQRTDEGAAPPAAGEGESAVQASTPAAAAAVDGAGADADVAVVEG